MRRIVPTFLCLALTLAPLRLAHAGTVALVGGDRYTGTIVRLQDGKLHLDVPYVEKHLVLPWAEVEHIASETSLTIHLLSGEVLEGRLQVLPRSDQLGVIGPDGATRSIRMDEIRAINPPALAPTLTGSVTLGGNQQSGNTDRTTANAAIDAVWRDRQHRFTFGFLYNYAEEHDAVTERDTFTRLKYDHFLSRRVYLYLETEFLYDRFKDIELRTAVGPGLGYQFWDDETKSLSFEAGLTWYHEDRATGANDSWLAARLATLLTWTFGPGLKFSEHLTLNPDLEETGELTLRNEASLSTPIAYGWSLQLRNIIEYDSDPETPGIESTDRSWVLGLNYSF